MLVLSARLHEKIRFPAFHTSVEVVSVQPGGVRLGIETPDQVRVVRDEVPDRVAEWGPAPVPAGEVIPPTLLQLNQLVDRRLDIAHRGLAELRQLLQLGQGEEAETILDKLDEDLHLLRRRLLRESETADPHASAAGEDGEGARPTLTLPCRSR